MTSPPSNFSDEFFIASFAHICGARIDAAQFVAQTGLVTLSLYKDRRLTFGVGIGPVATRIGLLPQLPIGRAPQDHPLLAALRSHIVGTFIRTIQLEDNALWITVENSNHDENPQSLPTRLMLEPGRHGKARILVPNGPTIEWPIGTQTNLELAKSTVFAENALDFKRQGIQLLEISNSFCIESLRRELGSIVRRRIQRLEKRLTAVHQDLARLDDVPHLQKIGSLLLSQGQNIPRGTRQAKLVDWETNAEIVVDIAPDKPAASQAAEFFQKARRIQRGADVMQKRLDETKQSLEAITSWSALVRDAPPDWEALQEIAKKLSEMGLGTSNASAILPHKRSEKNERKPYHTFRSTSGREIWVGKSGKDNDEMVTRLARPHDLWLHAKNIAGAHVIIPLDKHHACPPDVLVDAATLAAHFSNARREARCEVSYVERRYVRKPRKSAPGSVTTHHEKVIDVRIEKDRLVRLLGSKLETR